jgi:glucose repression mediator protein
MASVQHTTSPGHGQPQSIHQQGPPISQTNGHPAAPMSQAHAKPSVFQQLTQINEATWLQIGAWRRDIEHGQCADCAILGSLTELMGDLDRATAAYEAALRMNPYSIPAMNSISCILRTKEQFPKAVEYLQSILNMDSSNGEIWGSLGHCYLMMDDLQKAYSAYQQALYHLRDPKVRNRLLGTIE